MSTDQTETDLTAHQAAEDSADAAWDAILADVRERWARDATGCFLLYLDDPVELRTGCTLAAALGLAYEQGGDWERQCASTMRNAVARIIVDQALREYES